METPIERRAARPWQPAPGAGREPAASLAWAARLAAEIGKAVVGQQRLVHRLLVSLITGGHVLLEGAPGLAKTLVVRSLARACRLTFQRVQFTPDLLPADLIGTLIYNPQSLEFAPHKGPIFANVVLADEINRAPAKVQSALLEAMQERTVTIGHDTHVLDEPFLVLATQNPLEHQGTFPLPEAQLDRFLFQVDVAYPTRDEEAEILRRQLDGAADEILQVVSREHLLSARQELNRVYVDPAILVYVLDLVRSTRDPAAAGVPALTSLIRCGASPRAAVQFLQGARATAMLAGRGYVLPDDVREIALDVLRHRIVLSYDAEDAQVSADEMVTRLIAAVPCP